MSRWEIHARTDTGSVRDRNEDSYLADPDRGLFAVADGMGGRMSGDVASEIFVETLEEQADQLAESAARGDAVDDPETRERLLQRMQSVFLEANREIYNTGQGEMGTTGDALLVSGRAALVGHVGDSRIYLMRDGELNRLTTDHNYAERTDGEEGTDGDERRFEHVLTRALGTEPHVRVDTVFVELRPGDRFLLCTDGLTKHVEESEIAESAAELGPKSLVDKLLDQARSVGGVDDTTAICVEIGDDAPEEFDEKSTLETTDKLELLQQLGLFEGLEERMILRLLRHVYTSDFEAGEKLIERGSSKASMYIVVSGEASVRRNGRELSQIEPGEHVGEMSLVDQSPRSADVVAEQDLRALRISPSQFRQMVTVDAEVGNRILSNMLHECVDRLRRTTEQLLIDNYGGDS